MTLLQLIQQRQEEFDNRFNRIDVSECGYDSGEPDNCVIIDKSDMGRCDLQPVRKYHTQSLISILEHIIEEGEKKMQLSSNEPKLTVKSLEEMYYATGIKDLLTPIRLTVEELRKKV